MKLALGFVCLLLIWAGLFDLVPYRVVRREGRIQPLRRRPPAQRRKVART